MLPGAIGQCVSQFFGGRAMDRFGARPVALFGSIVLTLGTLGMSLVAMDTWIWWVSICQFIRQIGMGFLLMPITTWSLNCLNGPSEVSAGSSVTNTARQIAGAVGAPVLVILMERFAALHKQGAPPPSPLDFRHSMGAANLRNNLSGNGVDGVLRRQGRRCRSYARHYFLARAARTACAAYGCELTADSTILNIMRNPGSNTGASHYVVLSQDFSWSLLRPAHQRQDNQQHVERHNQCHHNHKNHVLDGSISPFAHEFLVMRVSHQRNHGERDADGSITWPMTSA